jgi:molecular chaperone DnaJ
LELARRDYYAVLGVRKNASTDDIRKAFRQLAMKYHPDRNPEDVEADNRFREIAEAWDVLGDPEKRERYDRLGPMYTHSGRPPSTEELNEILRDTLSGLLRRRKPDGPGEDLRYTLTLSLEEAARGIERSLTVGRVVRCRDCDGTGDAREGRVPCSACGGSGKSSTRRFFRSECPACDGRGYKPVARCERCHGEKRVSLEETLKIKVPAGVATGQKLKLRAKGNDPVPVPGSAGGAAGDLYVVVNVDDHPLFRRRGVDLLAEVPLTFAEATLGVDLAVPTLDGSTTIKVPPGTPSGKTFRLPGRGLANVDGGGKGDLHVKVVIEVPSTLTDEARKALLTFSERAGATAHPRRATYADAMRARR